MRIRRSASRLLGAAVPVSAPRRFDLPPLLPRFELPPPPTTESNSGVASKTPSSSGPEPCPTCFNPVDLMNQLDLSDPEEHQRFVEENSVPLLRRASWLFPAITPPGFINKGEEEVPTITPAGFIKEAEKEVPAITPVGSIKEDEEEEDMAVDMVEDAIHELHLAEENKASQKTAKKKNKSKPKPRKEKENAEVSEDDASGRVWKRKKKDIQHDQKLPGSSRPRRIGKKRSSAFDDPVNREFYFYTGHGPSRGSSRRSEQEEETLLPEEHSDVTPPQAQADVVVNEPRCDNGNMDKIAGYDETSSDGEPAGNIKRKIPAKKKWRKPVKARSINSLM